MPASESESVLRWWRGCNVITVNIYTNLCLIMQDGSFSLSHWGDEKETKFHCCF